MSQVAIAVADKYKLNADQGDKYDEMYATKLNGIFKNLSLETQKEFNEFTNNLMNEKFISRFKLLDAIEDFEKTDNYFNISADDLPDYIWIQFNNCAFNFRPYQTW